MESVPRTEERTAAGRAPERRRAASLFGRARSVAVLVLINGIVLLALLGAVNLGSAIVLSRALLAKPPLAGGPESPAYVGDERRMRAFFREYGQLTTAYRDFVGWHRLPFDGEAINVGAGGERSIGATLPPADAPIARFFGGSTMWGTGAVDAETIPALFASHHPEFRVHNHGESAFVARQGLAELVNVMSTGGSADLVVFYDGVNDVGALCRREIELPGTIRQKQFESVVDSRSGLAEARQAINTLLFSYTVRLIAQLRDDQRLFDCSTDPAKAARVAEHVVLTWRVAHDLVAARGGHFIGILQPVAYLGDAVVDHIANDLTARDSLGAEFAAVYPEIRKRMRGIPYLHDFTDAFDGETIVYSDWAHVNGRGNAVIVRRIETILESMVAESGTVEGMP